MHFSTLAIALLLQSSLRPVLAVNVYCSGVEYLNVCCQGSIIGPPSDINNLAGLTCCEGDKLGGDFSGDQTTCTSGSPVPMTQLSTASVTITQAAVSVTVAPSSASSSASASTSVLHTSTQPGAAVITLAPWNSVLVLAGGLAVAMV